MNKFNRKFKRDLFTDLSLLALGLVIQFIIIPKTIRVVKNPLMANSELVQNGRVLPSACGILIILSSVWLLIELFLNRKYYLAGQEEQKQDSISIKQVFRDSLPSIIFVLITIVFVLLEPVIGYLPSAILVVVALCLTYAYDNKVIMPFVAIFVPVILYLVFSRVLYVSF